MPLFHDERETVQMEVWAPCVDEQKQVKGGLEGFILDGSIEESGDLLSKGTWFRLPDGASFDAKSGPDGAKIWIKSGHLQKL